MYIDVDPRARRAEATADGRAAAGPGRTRATRGGHPRLRVVHAQGSQKCKCHIMIYKCILFIVY